MLYYNNKFKNIFTKNHTRTKKLLVYLLTALSLNTAQNKKVRLSYKIDLLKIFRRQSSYQLTPFSIFIPNEGQRLNAIHLSNLHLIPFNS